MLGGLAATARRSAQVVSGGVSITGTFDLAAGPDSVDGSGNVVAASGLRLAEMLQSSETSVAYAPNGVVLYTSNGGASGNSAGFGAAYSTNGGYTFTRLYATATAGTTSLFPYPAYPQQPGTFGCSPLCDQVVTYDQYNNMFIWVMQYPQNSAAASNPDFERIAWTSPQALARYGGAAWSYTDLQSSTISSTVALDQPRLGVTPGWVYISFNLPKASVVRIAHTAFKDLGFRRAPSGLVPVPVPAKIAAGAVQAVNSASCPGCSLRVARSTDGDNPGGSWTEYFGGIGTTTSSVDVASVADDSNVLISQNVPTWGMAITNGASLADWGSLVPSNANWLSRTSGTVANPSVTESHGIVFVAWNEGRTVYNAKQQPTDINGNPLTGFSSTYSQPHIGVAGFVDNSSYSSATTKFGTLEVAIPSYTLYYENELLNPNYALAMPDLATAADGEVAMGFYAGGGPSYASANGSIYVAHGVGFLWGGHGDPTFVTDARSNSFTSDTANVYGDYNTVAPLSTNGDCLVSSAVVTQTASQQDHPVFTLFSHPGNYCAQVRVRPTQPVQITTRLTLTCPAAATAGSVATVTGQLSPVPSGGAAVTVTVSGGAGAGAQNVHTTGSGAFSASFTPGEAGTYSVGASFGGAVIYRGSSATCSTVVAPRTPSSLAMNCPATAAPGDQLTLTATLSPATQGVSIRWTATAPDATVAKQADPTDATATSYFNVAVSQAGTWTFIASWAGDATHAGATGTCQVAVQAPTVLTVSCPLGLLHPSVPASIRGTLSPDAGDTPIAVAYEPPAGSGGSAATDKVATDSTGSYADTYSQDAGGKWTVTATFAGDATRAPAQASCQFTVLSG